MTQSAAESFRTYVGIDAEHIDGLEPGDDEPDEEPDEEPEAKKAPAKKSSSKK